MMNSPRGEKFLSEPNLSDQASNYISSRKRKETDDYSELRNDLINMFKSWSQQQDIKHKELIDIILESKKQNEDIKELLERSNKQIIELKFNQDSLILDQHEASRRIDLLEKELEEFGRLQYINMIEISNVPKTVNNNLDILVKNLHEAINIPFDHNSIKKINRAKYGVNKIIVEYKDMEFKERVLNAIKIFNKNSPDKINTHTLKLETEKVPIYVSELLTNTARKLFHSARHLVKDGKYKYCWVRDGKVMIRENDGMPAIRLKSKAHFDQLANKQISQA